MSIRPPHLDDFADRHDSNRGFDLDRVGDPLLKCYSFAAYARGLESLIRDACQWIGTMHEMGCDLYERAEANSITAPPPENPGLCDCGLERLKRGLEKALAIMPKVPNPPPDPMPPKPPPSGTPPPRRLPGVEPSKPWPRATPAEQSVHETTRFKFGFEDEARALSTALLLASHNESRYLMEIRRALREAVVKGLDVIARGSPSSEYSLDTYARDLAATIRSMIRNEPPPITVTYEGQDPDR